MNTTPINPDIPAMQPESLSIGWDRRISLPHASNVEDGDPLDHACHERGRTLVSFDPSSRSYCARLQITLGAEFRDVCSGRGRTQDAAYADMRAELERSEYMLPFLTLQDEEDFGRYVDSMSIYVTGQIISGRHE